VQMVEVICKGIGLTPTSPRKGAYHAMPAHTRYVFLA